MKKLFMNAEIFVVIGFACFFLLTGCSGDKKIVTGETKDVKWFVEHHEEREKAIAVCNEMSNLERMKFPNCENAVNAQVSIDVAEDIKKLHIDW